MGSQILNVSFMLLTETSDSLSLPKMQLSIRPDDPTQDCLDKYVTVDLTKNTVGSDPLP
jgi:hypothetical protein